MTGKMSVFGGLSDTDGDRNQIDGKPAHYAEGLSVYSHEQADIWPALFLPRNVDDPQEGVFRRLRPDALYMAYRFSKTLSKDQIRRIPWILSNMDRTKFVMVSVVDFGPAEDLDRVFDISPKAAELLGVQTNDTIQGFAIL